MPQYDRNPEFHLIAPLCNVSGPVEHVKIDDRFVIERWTAEQLDKTIEEFEGRHDTYASAGWACVDEKTNTALVIKGVPDLPEPPPDYFSHPFDHYIRHFNLINEKLANKLALMRLFADGNICEHSWWWFGNDGSRMLTSSFAHSTHVVDPYVITDQQLPELIAFLASKQLPLQQPYINVALENYQEAYQIKKEHMQLLSLTIALEALFTPTRNEGEMRYRISRSAAALLGGDRAAAESIMDIVKSSYDDRSKIVHRGDTSAATSEKVRTFRRIVRKLIFQADKRNLSKDRFLKDLTAAPLG